MSERDTPLLKAALDASRALTAIVMVTDVIVSVKSTDRQRLIILVICDDKEGINTARPLLGDTVQPTECTSSQGAVSQVLVVQCN